VTESEGDEPPRPSRRPVIRKRERPNPELETRRSQGKAPEAETPVSLVEKIELDFKNPALVEPTSSLLVPKSLVSVFGALRLGEKFSDDRPPLLFTKVQRATLGEDNVHAWQAPTWLRHGTDVAVLCQKGRKDDPTPNQDNFFVHHVGGVTIHGVCDGHGPFGHLVSFRLVQTLPKLLLDDEAFGTNWELALKRAFLGAQEDLVRFSKKHDVDIQVSGSAASMLVLDEQTVHLAFVGDARIMIGSWNRRDSRMVFCTQDHKPELPEERARLEAAGMEVREAGEGFRIYLRGESVPGLTMSRAFGDSLCRGHIQEPEYHRLLMQPTDEWYALIASDGIWEFIEGQEASTMMAKKLRLKGARETMRFITTASRRRWAQCCGDYCDDITGVLIQWNCHQTRLNANHVLSIGPP